MATTFYNISRDAVITDLIVEKGIIAPSVSSSMKVSGSSMILNAGYQIIETGSYSRKITMTPYGLITARFFIESGSIPVPPTPVNDILYDLTGSAFLSGSYDTFEAYSIGGEPANGGFGWVGPWVLSSRTRSPIAEDFISDYTMDTNVSESNGGLGWSGPWNVIEGN
jgi:hypothetical protein